MELRDFELPIHTMNWQGIIIISGDELGVRNGDASIIEGNHFYYKKDYLQAEYISRVGLHVMG